MSYDRDSLATQLRHREGNCRHAYRDSVGTFTIGIGHNLERPIPQEAVDLIYEADVAVAEQDLDSIVLNWRSLDNVRQQALVHLSFALGGLRLRKFKRMLAAIAGNDWPRASAELLDSEWARVVGDEPGQRADEVAQMLHDGGFMWPPSENGG